MQELPAALAAFAAYPQFILYRLVPRNDGSGKTDKFPVDSRTGAVSDAHNTAIWLPPEQALAAAAQQGLGVGFVFTANDPFFFFDIDDCLEESGQWSDWANYLCNTFTGAAIEISQSGQGLHIFGTGQAPLGHACKAKDAQGRALPFDLYTVGRFAALTGTSIVGDAGTDHTATLQQIAAAYLAPGPTLESVDWTDEPAEGYGGPEDDDELLARMLRSRSTAAVMGGKASLSDLWERNEDVLGRCYPHDQGLETFDHSDADMALCCHLAFWTGKDCERMDRLFRRSGLCRDKWLDREHNYRVPTILKAVALCSDVYNPTPRNETPTGEAPVSVDPGAAVVGELRAGFQYLAVTQQQEHFAGCTYVRDLHRVFTPDGALLKQEQFNATKGGFVFALDTINDKTTKKAWEVFTESQAYIFPRAHGVCFRPEICPGVIIEEEGNTLVNTYIPVQTERLAGDSSPFLGHLARLLPDPGDQAILLAYMAACVQYKGVKFQWMPLLQGVEGNGKTVFISCLAHAIGHRYTHLPDSADLGNKFNYWLGGKLFIGIEEVYVPAAKQEVMEALKPMITNSRIGLQGKGDNQITGDNRANFFACGNHKDGLRKNKGDRRYCMFFTAQQSPCDITRDGMGGQYFPQLYEWLRGGGYAVVNEFLHTYAIPDALNPATECHRAPQTSSTKEALRIGMGAIEQEVLEAVDEGRPGFANGWISSAAFDKLLEDRRASNKIPINKRRAILQDIGYDWHPSLKGGRVNNPLLYETGKPRLYIREGHISRNLKQPAEIVKAYIAAQGYPAMGTAGAAATG